MTDNWLARKWRSSGLVALAVVFYCLCGMLSLYFTKSLAFSDPPGGDVPWYFIRQDAIHGMCLSLYLAACLTIGTLAIKNKWPGGGAGMIVFGIIWGIAPVWQLGLIYLKSDHIFHPTAARTSWLTFESYAGDPLRWGWLLLFLFALPYVEQIKNWQKNRPD
ncbi:MAG TPA: hypothetical protein VNM67_02855 [Thermoanaerobaculia bacterium]|nr:hypothetical protein [Thermoanaerobaculia bacterium]